MAGKKRKKTADDALLSILKLMFKYWYVVLILFAISYFTKS